jgi:hypothetical protein
MYVCVGGVDTDIDSYAKQIDMLEEKVGDLEGLVEELENVADELGWFLFFIFL